MASSSVISTSSPEVPTKTDVKFSNSSAIAAAVGWGVQFGAVALLLGALHRGGDDLHPEAAELVLHRGEPRLGRGELRDGDHDADVLLEHVPVTGHHRAEEGVVVGGGFGQVDARTRRRDDLVQERLGQHRQQVLLVGEVPVERRG